MKLNQKGALDMMLVAALAVVLVVGGFVLVRISESDDADETTTTETAESAANEAEVVTDDTDIDEQEDASEAEATIPEGWVEYEKNGLSFIHPDDWEETTETAGAVSQNNTFDAAFTNTEGVGIKVHSSSPVRVFYSINAPFFCQLDGDTWNHYRYSGTSGTIVDERDEASDSNCDSFREEVAIGETVGFERAKGALSASGWQAGVEINGATFIFTDTEVSDSDDGPPIEPIQERVRSAAGEFANANL